MKKFYKENRVFVILMGIALVCVAIIIAIMTSYVIKSMTNNKLGSMLDGIEDVKITEEMISDMEASILEKDKVKDVVINAPDVVVYFNIDFENDATLDYIKSVAQECVNFFDKDYLNFYGINFSIEKPDREEDDGKYPIMGYLQSGTDTISWSNNAKE